LENERTLGVKQNFDKAVHHCGKSIIHLSDQDDVWMPMKIEQVSEAFSGNPDIGLAITDALITDENLIPLGKTIWQEFELTPCRRRRMNNDKLNDEMIRNHVMNGMVLSFRGTFKDIVLPIPKAARSHDSWLMLILSFISKFALIPDKLVKYRRHSSTVTKVGETTLKDMTDSIMRSNRRVRSLESRANVYLAAIERLENRYGQSGVEAKIAKARCASNHYVRRSKMPSEHLLRPPFVMFELVTGSYQRFAPSVWRAIVRDLVEPF
jgi:hypothetical protein